MNVGVARRERPTGAMAGGSFLKQALPKIFTTALFVLLAIIFLVPFYWMVMSSLRPSELIFSQGSQFIPTTVTIQNYYTLFTEVAFNRWFFNSIIISVGFAIVALAVCTLAAYPLARFHFPFRDTIFILILASQMLPFHMMVIPLFIMMINLQMIDTYIGVILPLVAHPFGLFYMRQYMLGLNADILDAARVDGASEYQLFLRIVLPLVRPAMGALLILFSLEGWNGLLWPLIVMRSEDKFPLAVGIAGLVGLYRPRWDLVMAASFLATLPIVILFLFMQKQFLAGMASMGTGVEK